MAEEGLKFRRFIDVDSACVLGQRDKRFSLDLDCSDAGFSLHMIVQKKT